MPGKHTFFAEIEAAPKPGPYADAIAAAKRAGAEYWGIWNILAFQPMVSYHLAELSHELMHRDAPIGAALRELIAAYTSSLNGCDFCRNAHAAVAQHLYADRALVAAVLRDPETSSLAEKDKALLRFVRRLTLQPEAISEADTELLKQNDWDEPSIFYAVGACGLFNFYNRFVLGNGVHLVSDQAFDRLGERIARQGYSRERPPNTEQEPVTTHA